MSSRGLGRFAPAIPPCVLEELAQEAWLRTWAAPAVRHPEAFARRTAHRLAVDWLRRRREEPLSTETADPSPWGAVDARLDLEGALDEAPEPYRAIAVRHFLAGEPLETLIEEAAGGPRAEVGEVRWGRARDATYKRRSRGLAWFASRLSAPAR